MSDPRRRNRRAQTRSPPRRSRPAGTNGCPVEVSHRPLGRDASFEPDDPQGRFRTRRPDASSRAPTWRKPCPHFRDPRRPANADAVVSCSPVSGAATQPRPHRGGRARHATARCSATTSGAAGPRRAPNDDADAVARSSRSTSSSVMTRSSGKGVTRVEWRSRGERRGKRTLAHH
jgi:hypothetical protein